MADGKTKEKGEASPTQTPITKWLRPVSSGYSSARIVQKFNLVVWNGVKGSVTSA